MLSFRFFLFCVVDILCMCLCVGSSQMNKCVETDRQALLKLKDGFINGRDILSSWQGEDCCTWKGISCDNLTGLVTSLDVHFSYYYSAGLGGKLDDSICELQHVTSLDLSYNNLEGKIPNCIGSLGQLLVLQLANNKLVSDIPPTLGNLSNLQTLDLSYNHLLSNDLQWVSHLFDLRYLDLSNNTLSGAVDWLSSISKIRSLKTLNLDDCGLRQVNPKSIPQLNSSNSLQTLSLSRNELNSSTLSWLLNVSKALTRLDLSYNFLQHSIPDGFANMISLQYLRLSGNELEGSIPQSFQNLCQLRELSLDSNKLSGPITDNIQNLGCAQNGLDLLDLSHNQLNGTLPYSIGQFSSLTRLLLSSNELNGVISEAHLSNLSSLQFLDVADNSLSFNLSSNWVPPFQLGLLDASSCILGPKFPTWLKNLKSLTYLQISNCGISDSIPEWFWDLSSSLSDLRVSHNKLSGVLPKSFASMKTTFPGVWDFSFNNLSGPLPPFPQVYALILSNNMFLGSLSSFCATSPLYLAYLDLSSNLLAGPLSDCWGQFQNLQILNLAYNNFSGVMPISLATLGQIETLHLNNNNFSGEFPSLTLCSKLKLIDFGDNNLKGTLPAWVGHNMDNLIVLRLRANKFQGEIPTSLCNLLGLQVLDLSQNNITGEIPQCLSNIIALSNSKFPRKGLDKPMIELMVGAGSVINEATLAWKGKDREYGKILRLMTSIDLSCNHLTGEIPQSITMLVALAVLNLSGNNLTGFIPNNIGHMQMLESLDLSRNLPVLHQLGIRILCWILGSLWNFIDKRFMEICLLSVLQQHV